MGTRQMQAIERGVIEAYEGISGPDDPPRRCCTITAQSSAAATVWVQVLAGSVNCMYPFAGDPVEHLRVRGVRSPQGIEVIEWEANTFVTFGVPASSTRDLAYFVDQMFTRVLDCNDADYEPVVMVEALDP